MAIDRLIQLWLEGAPVLLLHFLQKLLSSLLAEFSELVQSFATVGRSVLLVVLLVELVREKRLSMSETH